MGQPTCEANEKNTSLVGDRGLGEKGLLGAGCIADHVWDITENRYTLGWMQRMGVYTTGYAI